MPVRNFSDMFNLIVRSRHLLITFSVRGMSALGIILVTIIVAKEVSVEISAQIFLFMAASNGVAILARFGSDVHIVRRVAIANDRLELSTYGRDMARLLVVTSILSFLIWACYARFMGNNATATVEYILLVCILAVFINVSHSASSWLKGLGKPASGAFFEGNSFYLLLLPILLITPEIKPILFYYQAAAVCAVMCTVAFWIAVKNSKLRKPVRTTKLVNEPLDMSLSIIFSQCLPLSVIAVLAFVSQGGLLFIADYLGSPALVSELNVLLRLMMPLVLIQTTLDSFLAPKFASAFLSTELRTLRLNGIMAISAIAFPVFVVFCVFAEPIVLLLFGENYKGLAKYVPWSYLILYISCCLGANGMLLMVKDFRVLFLWVAGIRAVTVMILAIWLIPTIGMFGGALAYLTGLLAQGLLARYFVDRSLKRKYLRVS